MDDPLEAQVEEALIAAGIRFVKESEATKNLDFYLPDYGVYIEVKGGHTERISDQMGRDNNVIAIQGMKSTRFIVHLLSHAQR